MSRPARRSLGFSVATAAALSAMAPVAAQAAPTATYQFQAGDTLASIADRFGVSVAELKAANSNIQLGAGSLVSIPAAPSAPVTYTVKRGDTLSAIALAHGTTVDAIASASNLSNPNRIFPGQVLRLPGGATSTSASAPARQTESARSYTVKSGDNLSKIAAAHGTTVAGLMRANNLSSTVIFPGQTLQISGSSATSTTPASSRTSQPAPAQPAASASQTTASNTGSTYTVKRGDTISKIAAAHGTTVAAIATASNLSNPNRIYPGQVLKLSGSPSNQAAPAPTSTSAPSTAAPAVPASSSSTYTVRSGDTLSGIAARTGTTVASLRQVNSLRSTVIYPGQVLRISGGQAQSSSQGQTPSSSGNQNLVPSTFLHYTYPEATVRSANENKAYLNSIDVPSRSQIQAMVRSTAIAYGVDPALAQAHAFRESGFDARAVSPANAIGPMQVIPSSGEWASQLAGRELNLLDPQDNIVAGVVIIRQLHRSTSFDNAIAAYYQGLGSVNRNGMFPDTRDYVAKVKSSMAQF